MRVNLNQLYVFYLAARHKSLKAAAGLLYVSPPAVTMQVKKLENWLGFAVFERGQGELRLTERGQELYAVVEPVLGGLDALERQIDDLMRNEESVIRLGAHHIPANYFIPDLIAHVRSNVPTLKIQMELGTQDSLLEKLFQQKLDLALIIDDPPEGLPCKVFHLFDVEVALVVAADGEYGKIDSISVKDIKEIPLILQQKGTGALRSVLQLFDEYGVQPNILFENISSDVIKTFLLKAPSGALIGRFIAQKELDEGIFHEIKIVERTPTYSFNLIYSDNQNVPPKLERFFTGAAGFSPIFKSII